MEQRLERPSGNEPEAPPLPLPADLRPPAEDPDVERLLGNLEKLLDEEQGFRSKVRSLPTATRGLVAGGAALFAVLCVFLLVRRADFAAVRPWQLELAIGSYMLPLGILIWRLLLPLHRVETRSEHFAALITASFALPFLWAVVPPRAIAHVLQAADIRRDCLLLGLLVGGAFIALLRLLDRAADGDPRSLAMGAAAGGLLANLALVIHCPQTRFLHLALGHAPIGLLLLWAYRRAARWGAPPRAAPEP